MAPILETMSEPMPSTHRSASDAPRRVVLVTGAARRIGREIALDLAEHGFDVAVHYRSNADEAQATVADLVSRGAAAHAFACRPAGAPPRRSWS
jgi:NAD(P)-dependent dehydrogenase (short-subunit alcohol dehydrogenase family)